MSRRIGRNDPCPCGSGMKYKKCCMETEGAAGGRESESERKRTFDEFTDLMDRTEQLVDRFEWTDPFLIDAYDPVVVEGFVEFSSDVDIREHFMNVIFEHCERLTPVEVRADIARQARALLRRERVPPELRRLLEAIMNVAAALEIHPLLCGAVRQLYVRAVEKATVTHIAQQQREAAEPCEEALSLTKLLVASRHILTVEATVQGLISLGPAALPALEQLFDDLDPEESGWETAGRRLIRVLRGIPCHRSINLMMRFFDDEELWQFCLDDLNQVLAELPLARQRVVVDVERGYPDLMARHTLITTLVSLGDPGALDLILSELNDVHDEWEEGYPPDDLIDEFVRLAEEAGDVRTPGKMLRLLLCASVPRKMERKLRRRLSEGRWGAEILAALSRHESGQPIFIESSEDPGEMIARCLQSVLPAKLQRGLKSVEELQPFLDQAQAIANRAYHEENDWASPQALYSTGPKEQKVMQCYLEAMHRAAPGHLVGPEASAWQHRFQEDWMTTRCPELDHQFPLAVVLREQRDRSQSPFLLHYQEKRLMELYQKAVTCLDQGDTTYARRMSELMLTVDPDHPFAKLLADEANSVLRIA